MASAKKGEWPELYKICHLSHPGFVLVLHHGKSEKVTDRCCTHAGDLPGAAKAIGDVLPLLKGKMDGFSYRVPVIDGSIADMSLNLVKPAPAQAITDFLKHHAATTLKSVLEYTEESLVSADILGNTHSSVV